jgi:hypothetical protein
MQCNASQNLKYLDSDPLAHHPPRSEIVHRRLLLVWPISEIHKRSVFGVGLLSISLSRNAMDRPWNLPFVSLSPPWFLSSADIRGLFLLGLVSHIGLTP